MKKIIKSIHKKICLFLYYYFAIHLPNQPFFGYKIYDNIRGKLCKNIFAQSGKKIVVRKGAYFGDGDKIQIGDYSQLGTFCHIDNDIVIGEKVLMAPYVVIYSSSHEYKDITVPIMDQGGG